MEACSDSDATVTTRITRLLRKEGINPDLQDGVELYRRECNGCAQRKDGYDAARDDRELLFDRHIWNLVG